MDQRGVVGHAKPGTNEQARVVTATDHYMKRKISKRMIEQYNAEQEIEHGIDRPVAYEARPDRLVYEMSHAHR